MGAYRGSSLVEEKADDILAEEMVEDRVCNATVFVKVFSLSLSLPSSSLLSLYDGV